MNLTSGARRRAEINMTPMIDILLVLLIIFMAIAPSKSEGLAALVPQPPANSENRPPENPLVLELSGDGAYRLNSQTVAATALEARLAQAFSLRGDRLLFVKAALEMEFGAVASAIDAAHSAQVDRIALMPK